MRVTTCRCEHCRIRYSYPASGRGFDPRSSNDTYCTECFEKIREALSKVPVKKHCVYLPYTLGIDHFNPLTIEEFKAELKENLIVRHSMRFFGYTNLKVQSLTIRGVDYELWTNKDTNEELLAAAYEFDAETQSITGLWNVKMVRRELDTYEMKKASFIYEDFLSRGTRMSDSIFSEFAMKSTSDSVFYTEHVYADDKEKS
jgi:copper chaperone CopZ